MSVHRYTSRGRTRQPKNLVLPIHEGSSGQSITFAHFKASGSATVVPASSNLNDLLNDTVEAENGYDTQNQQFLHLCVRTTGAAGAVIDVYGYNRQFGTWGQLKTPQRTNQANFYDSMINVSVSGSPNSTHYVTFPINGVDRVGFVCSDTKDVLLYVAGSSF